MRREPELLNRSPESYFTCGMGGGRRRRSDDQWEGYESFVAVARAVKRRTTGVRQIVTAAGRTALAWTFLLATASFTALLAASLISVQTLAGIVDAFGGPYRESL